jgi:hypothetical protein
VEMFMGIPLANMCRTWFQWWFNWHIRYGWVISSNCWLSDEKPMHQYCFILWCETLLTLALPMLLAFKGWQENKINVAHFNRDHQRTIWILIWKLINGRF